MIDLKQFLITEEEDASFRAQLLKDIPYFHHLYQKYHHTEALECAKGAGELAAKL